MLNHVFVYMPSYRCRGGVVTRKATKAGYREHLVGNGNGGYGPLFSIASGMDVHPRFCDLRTPANRSRVVADVESPPTGTGTKLFDLLCAQAPTFR